MTVQEIINSSFTKTKKAFLLYDIGYTRRDVANWLTAGNYGFAHNIWKKWNATLTGNPTDQPISIAPFHFEFNRTFGIELEIYGPSNDRIITEFRNQGVDISFEDYNHNTRNHWKIVRDSSVSGENGCEIVSPVLQGEAGIEQIKKITISLGKASAKVNTTCGFHVHFGANDFGLDQFKALAKNHINLEKALDELVPESRRQNKNSYCKSLSSVRRSKAEVINSINTAASVNELVNLFSTRYLKVNFQSFVRQGTVEFRHHSGTVTYSKIKNWILICARLMEFSKANNITNNLNTILNEALTEYVKDRAIDLAA